MFRSSSPETEPTKGWWSSPLYIALLALLAAVPLLWPSIPPLTDLMGHMGRYRVELADPGSPLLTRFYAFKWAVMGNLGVDLLIIPMAKLFGLEFGVKLIVLAIPPLTVAGMLLVAREAHGRLPATAVFALPLAYGFPFQWGFVNFALSMALCLLAFAMAAARATGPHGPARAALRTGRRDRLARAWFRLGRARAARLRGRVCAEP
jgi:hypothetical protein